MIFGMRFFDFRNIASDKAIVSVNENANKFGCANVPKSLLGTSWYDNVRPVLVRSWYKATKDGISMDRIITFTRLKRSDLFLITIDPKIKEEKTVKKRMNSLILETLLKDKSKLRNKTVIKRSQGLNNISLFTCGWLFKYKRKVVDTTTKPSKEARFIGIEPISIIVKLDKKSRTGLNSKRKKRPHLGLISNIKKLKQINTKRDKSKGLKFNKGSPITKTPIASMVAIAEELFLPEFFLDMISLLW